MKKLLLTVAALLFTFNTMYGKVIQGEIKEKYLDSKIEGVSIIVKGKSQFVKSDMSGRFEIDIGEEDSIKILKKGYKPIEIKPEMEKLLIELEKENILYNEVIKVAAKERKTVEKEVSKTELSGNEIRSVQNSGFFSDITNAVSSLPGVARSGEFSSLMYVRGGEPYEVLNVINGVPMFWPYRWGGRSSVFNTNLIEKADLYSGGFGGKYSEAMSGVLAVEYKDGDKNKTEGELTLGAETNGQISGGIGNGSYLFGYRRTFYDIFMNNTPLEDGTRTTYPFYEDFYVSANQKISRNDILKGWLLYSNEGMNFKFRAADKDKVLTKKDDGFEYQTIMMIGDIQLKHLIDDKSFLKFDFSYTNQKSPKIVFNDIASQTDIHYSQGGATLLGEYNLEYEKNLLKAGTGWVRMGIDDIGMKISTHVPNNVTGKFEEKLMELSEDDKKEYLDRKINVLYGFIENEFKINDFTVTPGINSCYSDIMKNNRTTFDPRLSMRYELNPKTFFKFATGLYSMHSLSLNVTNDNPNLKPEKTIHYVAGFEHELNEDYKFRVETYYKDMRDLMVYDPENINKFNGNAFENVFKNIGEGNSKGIELFLQKKETANSNFDGWISYTYGMTQKKDNSKDNPNWYYPQQDQRHTFNLTGNYYIIKNNEIELVIKNKFDYYSGRPEKAFEIKKCTIIDKDNKSTDIFVRFDKKGEYERMPDYFRWDISLEMTNKDVFNMFDITGFLQIMNVSDHKNVSGYSVAPFAESVEKARLENIGFKRTPIGGLKIKF